MTPTAWSLLFGGLCLLAAAVISVACCATAARNGMFDAEITIDKTPDMGDPTAVDPSVWHPNAETWGESATPIYAQLAAETAAREAAALDDEWAAMNGGRS